MLAPLAHRGPDSQAHHIDEKQGLALGHTRLSINDLRHDADQPLWSSDRRYVITVNGEFYDFKKFRALAMAEGERYSCKSDSEIALTLYKKFGLDFVKHLRGEFAFVLYDEPEDTFILVRDRFGIRPMFYHINDGTIYYGSEVKALLAHPNVPARLDRKQVLNQLMQTMTPGASAFEGIHALEPGHMLIVKRRNGSLDIKKHKYWDLDFPLESDRDAHPDEETAIAGVREKLVEAIVLRLEADVPVGCYLSGGIDSCCILGLATGAMQSPVKAFTISFDDDAYDEASIARQMAESMGADQEVINLKGSDLYGENYINTAWHAERTFYNTLGVAKYLMSRRVHECGYKSVITGEGSDELFAGYPALKRDMFLHGLKNEPASVRDEYQRKLEESNRIFKGAILSDTAQTHEAWEELCGFTPSWIQPWIATLEVARPLLSKQVREEIGDYDPVASIAGQIDKKMLDGRHALDKAQYTWAKCQLEGQILNWGGDRVDMAHSMESRPAFLDHHLAEFAFQIDPKLRIKGTTEKYVLREAVKGVLPEVLYKREKFAFMAPPAHTDPEKARELNKLLDRFTNRDAIEEAGVLDPDAVEKFIKEYREDKDPVSLTRKDTVINHLLCLQILHQKLVKEANSATAAVA